MFIIVRARTTLEDWEDYNQCGLRAEQGLGRPDILECVSGRSDLGVGH